MATIPPEPLPSPQIFQKLKKKNLRARPTECDPRPRDYNPIFFFSKLYRIKEPTSNYIVKKIYYFNKLKKGKKEKEEIELL